MTVTTSAERIRLRSKETRSISRNPRNQNGSTTIGNIVCSPIALFNILTIGTFYKGTLLDTGTDIIVRKGDTLTEKGSNKIRSDVQKTLDFEKKSTTYILKIRSRSIKPEYYYIGYEHCENSLRNFLQDNVGKLSKSDFMMILRDILEAVEFIHSEDIVLKNISVNSFVICMEDKRLKAKLLYMSEDEASTGNVLSDIKDLGRLFLFMITLGKDIYKFLSAIIETKTIEDNVENVYLKFKPNDDEKPDFNGFLDPYREKLFIRLIIRLIGGEVSEIQNIKDDPFFWDYTKIEDLIKVVKSYADTCAKKPDKKMIEMYNNELNNTNWKEMLDEELRPAAKDNYKNNSSDCNRFIRNRITHYREKDEPLNPFFEGQGGPTGYFLSLFKDHFYDTFIFHEKYIKNRVIENDNNDEVSATAESSEATSISPLQQIPTTSNNQENCQSKAQRTQHHNKGMDNKFTSSSAKNSSLNSEENRRIYRGRKTCRDRGKGHRISNSRS